MGWWEAAADHRLVVQRCTSCNATRHPPGPLCPACRSFAFDWMSLPGTGTVYTYTVVRQAFIPALGDSIPYVVAVVELDGTGGARLVSNVVDVDAAAVAIGMPVEVAWEDMGPELALPRFRRTYSVDGLVAGAIVVFALMTAAIGHAPNFAALGIIMFTAGAAWISILASLNVTAQTMCPPWMRARALSLYLLVLQGGMSLGATLWGALASRVGVPTALLYASGAMLAGLTVLWNHRLNSNDLRYAPGVVRE